MSQKLWEASFDKKKNSNLFEFEKFMSLDKRGPFGLV